MGPFEKEASALTTVEDPTGTLAIGASTKVSPLGLPVGCSAYCRVVVAYVMSLKTVKATKFAEPSCVGVNGIANGNAVL
jgi:hypothetical protein